MRSLTRVVVAAGVAVLASAPLRSAPVQPPLYQQFLSPASPQEVVAARKVDRVAWVDYAEGKRNAYTAAAPAFTPVRLTNFMKDDGIMMSGIRISDDGIDGDLHARRRGRTARAGRPIRRPIPTGPITRSGRRAPAARRAWRVVDATNPELAPDGSAMLFVKDGQIYRAKVTPVKPGARGGSRREGVHHRVGRAERAEVVARRPQDRVRQHPHRSQLHRRLRHRDAHGEVHVAERGLRHDADVAARQQAPDVHAAAGSAVRAAGAAGQRAASACRTVRRFSRRGRGQCRSRRPGAAVAAAAVQAAAAPGSASARRRRSTTRRA